MSSHGPLQLTFLFADLSGFTALTETHGDDNAADIVARLYTLWRRRHWSVRPGWSKRLAMRS